MSHSLLIEAHLVKNRIASHEVAENQSHLDNILPDLVLFLSVEYEMLRIEILAFIRLAVFLNPCHSLLELFLIINAQLYATLDLGAVNILCTHTEIVLEEIRIRNRACNTH